MNGLFKNTHDALTFAFNFSSQQYAESQMAKLQRRTIGSGKGLVGIDGAAQAGLILAELKKMGPMRFHCLVARHAQRYTECNCCGGEKRTQVWNESIVALREWAMVALSGCGISHTYARDAIIRKYFGDKVSMQEVAKKVNMPIKTIYDQRSKILKELKKLDDAAQEEMHSLLRYEDGLIE